MEKVSTHEHEITETLREILSFVGADLKYAEYAQLHGYMEWFLKNCKLRGYV